MYREEKPSKLKNICYSVLAVAVFVGALTLESWLVGA